MSVLDYLESNSHPLPQPTGPLRPGLHLPPLPSPALIPIPGSHAARLGFLTPNSFLSLPVPRPRMPFPVIFTGQSSPCNSDHSLHLRPFQRHLTWPPIISATSTLESSHCSTLILCRANSGTSLKRFYIFLLKLVLFIFTKSQILYLQTCLTG